MTQFTFNSFFKGTKGTGAFNVVQVHADSTAGFAFTLVGSDALMDVRFTGANDRSFMQKLAARFSKSRFNGATDEEKAELATDKRKLLEKGVSNVRPMTASSTRFLRAFAFVEPAMSDDETQLSLNAVRIHKGNMVATDGHRMHHYTGAFLDDEAEFSVPGNVGHLFVRSLYHAFLEDVAQFSFQVDGAYHGLSVASSSLSVSLLYVSTDQFPAYEQVMPSEEQWLSRITGKARDFIASLEGTPVKMSGRSTKQRTLRITQDAVLTMDLDGVTPVKALSCALANSEDRSTEQDTVIAYEDRYLREAVDDDGEFTLLIVDPLAPLIWRQGAAAAYIMPMRA